MNDLDIIKNEWKEIHTNLENLLYSVSSHLRSSCLGGYIHGFYDKKSTDIYKYIKNQTGYDISSIKGLILSGDEKLLRYHINIDNHIYNYLENMNLKENKLQYQNDGFNRTIYNASLDFGRDFRTIFKDEFTNIPLTYLVKHLQSLDNKEISETYNQIYDPNDSTRDKLKKVNKKIQEILFNMNYNKYTVADILRERYSFYGNKININYIKEQRLGDPSKSISQLYDKMDEIELAHHLNISVEILKYLSKINKDFISNHEIEETVRIIALKEAIDVYKNEGILPINYQNKKEKVKTKQYGIKAEQLSFL